MHRALRVRAANHGRSTEAEVREILERAVKSEQRVRIGDALAELSGRLGLSNEDFEVFDQVRDKARAEPMKPAPSRQQIHDFGEIMKGKNRRLRWRKPRDLKGTLTSPSSSASFSAAKVGPKSVPARLPLEPA